MNRLTISRENMFQRIDHLAKRQMYHHYLAQRGIQQVISRFHFDIGYEILTAANVEQSEAEEVLTAVLLLEQGLSIHDSVDDQVAVQPLIVLAGDFDSSKYYYILAQLNHSRLIHVLCEAVAAVNEAKMRMVTEPELDVEAFLDLMEVVEGQLLSALASYYLREREDWYANIQSLVRAYIVQTELMERKSERGITPVQASKWLKSKSVHTSATHGGPLYRCAVEYFQPLQQIVEDMRMAEGNH